MEYSFLLLCRDHHSLPVLAGAWRGMGVKAEGSVSAAEALEQLARRRYAALVVDFDVPGAAQVARMARAGSLPHRPVVFAMLSSSTPVAIAFEAGANFVLYKPLVEEQVARSLRAGRCFMKPDRRKSRRERTEIVAHLQFGLSVLPVLVLELSENGASIQTAEPLPPVREIPFSLALPGSRMAVEGTAEVLWADEFGRAGLSFSQLSADSRRHMKSWRAKHEARRQSARAVRRPGVRAGASASLQN